MNQDDNSFSDLDFLLSKDNITKDELQQLPELPPEEPTTPSNQTSITHELENLSITPTDKPTMAINYRPRKRKPTAPLRQYFHKQKRNDAAIFNYNTTQNPQFQLNLTYKMKENINQ